MKKNTVHSQRGGICVGHIEGASEITSNVYFLNLVQVTKCSISNHSLNHTFALFFCICGFLYNDFFLNISHKILLSPY